MEKTLSLHIGHDATAMFIDDKGYIAISEERISRVKNFYGFPIKAIKTIFEKKNVNWSDIKKLIITSTSLKNSKSYKNHFFFNFINQDFSNEISLSSRFLFLCSIFKKKKSFDEYLKEFLYVNRFRGKILYYDHHLCHIASSLATYPINNSYLLSLDGGGDNINWSFYSYYNFKLKLLENSKSFYQNKKFSVHDTPADIYSNTTKYLGFMRLKDEGKVMGLSASGKPIYLEYFKSILKFENGRFKSKFGPQKRSLLKTLQNYLNFFLFGINYDYLQIRDMKKFLKNYTSKEDISASLQLFSEEITHQFLDYLSKKYKFKSEKLLLSGGFFSNVSVNKKIKERKDINNVFIVPNMGDGGLVLGGIYMSLKKVDKKKFSHIQKNVFFGSCSSKFKPKAKYNLLKFKKDRLYDYISECLIKNKIVGVINNKMEFGPRALGNRSILANPSNVNITDILNKKLKRSDFMPFAPMIRDIDAKNILENYSSKDYTARFMTITYNVKFEFKRKLKNIIHKDNTIRVQVIDKSQNKLCYNILTQFYKKTGIPCLINTSFNIHEEPIVMDIEDGLRALDSSVVDLIVNEKEVLEKK